jgi:hypothetical protein
MVNVREYLFGGGDRFPSRYRAVEVLAVVAYAWVMTLIAVEVVRGVASMPLTLWLFLPVAFVAHVASDFVSGIVHWAADTYATATTPFVGPKFVRAFREHHDDPLAITHHDFVEANGDNCLVSQLVLLPAYSFIPFRSSEVGVLLGFFVIVFIFSVLLTSIAHAWAHTPDPPRIARVLQRLGLVVSPSHHAKHHVAPHDRHFCITTGWMNPILDRSGFFTKLEKLLAIVGIRRSDVESRVA